MALSLSQSLIRASLPISQGAEAKVYKAQLSETSLPILLKYRFQKHYRHPSLDNNLTRTRIAGEARALLKCLRSGVNVPGIRMVDAAEGVLGIEWIEGQSLRKLLGGTEEEGDDLDVEATDTELENPLKDYGVSVEELMKLVGIEIAKMHKIDVIHGDLTTSNMMLRRPKSVESTLAAELVLIDFGLSYQSTLTEDKAVDLYVLERAFSSTHPDSEPMFATVLVAYANVMDKDWPAIRNRLEDG
ncbi:kinase-like domain-containing protein [Rhodocollybia butyracea]|uniref:non-specific serine/threonine protein kinase n=1 Tax=Rhodocollybia butyracea TaxID=206335 RepID=A0A9P5PZW3_9AGAR|nr:kinase-like domain-containing protein [Rhodocollybia butyracea]